MSRKLSSGEDSTGTVKFLYSYGGKILLRPTDGEIRYVGGHTRILSVDRYISYSELIVKFGESCGFSPRLKCKLPNEDLDVLISVKSDEDLQNVIEEYERASPEAKIRAVLLPFLSANKVSPPASPLSCFDFPSDRKPTSAAACRYLPPADRPFINAGKCRYCGEPRTPRHFQHVSHRIN